MTDKLTEAQEIALSNVALTSFKAKALNEAVEKSRREKREAFRRARNLGVPENKLAEWDAL